MRPKSGEPYSWEAYQFGVRKGLGRATQAYEFACFVDAARVFAPWWQRRSLTLDKLYERFISLGWGH